MCGIQPGEFELLNYWNNILVNANDYRCKFKLYFQHGCSLGPSIKSKEELCFDFFLCKNGREV